MPAPHRPATHDTPPVQVVYRAEVSSMVLGHATASLVAATTVPHFPAAHAVQYVNPGAVLYEPVGHCRGAG